MGIPSHELAKGLEAEHGGALHRLSCSFVEIPPEDIEDEPADLGEKLSVMAEEHSQAFGQTERHESVRKTQQKIILSVLGEEQDSFLRTGRAEMEAFAAERPEELGSAFGVGALYAGDSLCIITA